MEYFFAKNKTAKVRSELSAGEFTKIFSINLKTCSQVEEIDEPTEVYDKLMKLVVRLARYGIIHGDLNEFNLLITNSVSFFVSGQKNED